MESLVTWFTSTLGAHISREAIVFIISLFPILELRGPLSQSCGQKFLHSITVLHKIAVLQFIRKSTSIFPPTVYCFFVIEAAAFFYSINQNFTCLK